jgi:hypothetical protein
MLKELFDWLTKFLSLLAVFAVIALAIVAFDVFTQIWSTGYHSTIDGKAPQPKRSASTPLMGNGPLEPGGDGTVGN